MRTSSRQKTSDSLCLRFVLAGWYQSVSGTAPGTYGPISKVDMQAAVWTLTGNNRFGKAGWLPGQSLPPASNDVVNCMVYNALTADVPMTYTPPCGGTMAVVLLPCDVARATGRVRAMMVRRETYDQVTVTQVPVRCECPPPSLTTQGLSAQTLDVVRQMPLKRFSFL